MQHEFSFPLIGLQTYDMELLNSPLVPEITKSGNPRLIAVGATNKEAIEMIEIPFNEIIKIHRDDPADGAALWIHVMNTEGYEKYEVIDFRVIHY